MKLAGIVCLALVAWLGAAAGASAQDDIAQELRRKARAKELDEGFCEKASEKLERLGQPHVRARINEIFARSDSDVVTLLFVSDEAVPAQTCIYIVFHPAAMKGGKKCRASEIYGCTKGRGCRMSTEQPICEKAPGVWD
jgi:hypothetical protein